MESSDVLNYSAAAAALILTGFLCYTLYNLSSDLKILKGVLLNVKSITDDIDLVKNQIKLLLSGVASWISSRKEVNGKSGKKR